MQSRSKRLLLKDGEICEAAEMLSKKQHRI